MTLSILGGGSWGTALSIVLAPRFDRVRLWVFERDLAEQMRSSRENGVYLPGLKLPDSIAIETALASALNGAEIVLCVMPSRHARRVYTEALPHLDPSMTFVSATKGIEQSTLLRMSQVLREVILLQSMPRHQAPGVSLGLQKGSPDTQAVPDTQVAPGSRLGLDPSIAVLSGPTFALEVARGEPAAVVVASEDLRVAARVQAAFSGPTFRLYTNSDPIGVEVGAALKNVIAIGAGVCQGLGLGNNTLAALITRGLAEITRLAVAMGGQPKTLAGLAGLGDLVLTCSGELSRNRRVGMELAKGRPLPEIVASMPMIAEGVETCAAAVALGEKFGVDLPIIQQMHAVLYAGKGPREALRDLLERSLKGE
jgi:glycerol-3-phosphate dehydrogenase (NAD(P)+)